MDSVYIYALYFISSLLIIAFASSSADIDYCLSSFLDLKETEFFLKAFLCPFVFNATEDL
jgi:hypothetical protein